MFIVIRSSVAEPEVGPPQQASFCFFATEGRWPPNLKFLFLNSVVPLGPKPFLLFKEQQVKKT
jgi:hypothetical protein